jgi:hypothetical protein
MEETVKENEQLAEETPVLHSPAPVRKHTLGGLIRDMWPAYLIEIFVIILGISVSLALEEWRDTGKEKRLENIYIRNLLSNVDSDLQSLQYTSVSTKQIVEKGNELLSVLRDPAGKTVSSKEIVEDVNVILGRPKFLSNDVTFTDLKSSGNLHLIKDIALKNLLFSYYNLTQNIRDVQDAEQQATIILSGPYFLKRFPLDDKTNPKDLFAPEEISGLVKNIEFKNNVLLRVQNRQELLNDYLRADSTALLLKNVLTQSSSD